jgi:hypothetical protein
MCTLSVVASRDGQSVRLLMNRDERRLRPLASPPAVHAVGDGLAIWPRDPVSDGTWIAVTDAGVALAIMNVDGHRTGAGGPSRGTLVPILASCRSIDQLRDAWSSLDTSAFAPFRLVVLTRDTIAIGHAHERTLRVTGLGPEQPRLIASSSLGDAEVEPLRKALFSALLRTEIDPQAAQTRLHRHAWPDRRHLSVMMSRESACTVSQTEVALTVGAVSLGYRPVVDGWLMAETRLTLPVTSVRSRAA